VLAIVAGGGTAAAVHVVKAKLRLLSTVATAGLGNPLLSLGEDALSLAGTIGALVVPVVMIVLMAAGTIAVLLAIRRFRQRAARFEPGPIP
jgi:hypothetical protein